MNNNSTEPVSPEWVKAAYDRWPDPHDSRMGALRYAYIEGRRAESLRTPPPASADHIPDAGRMDRKPDGYAYRYPDGCIRFTGGREVNGSKPTEAIPYFFGATPEPATADVGKVDVAQLNRELCQKEGHVLGVAARPCLRCHEWFDPQYGRPAPEPAREQQQFQPAPFTEVMMASGADVPDCKLCGAGMMSHRLETRWMCPPPTKPERRGRWESTGLCGCTGELKDGERPFACEHGYKTELQSPGNGRPQQ